MSAKYEYPPTEFDPKPRSVSGARSYMLPLLAIAAAVAILDRITKHIIIHRLPEGNAHTIIPGVLRVTHVQNTGAAFSMFAESASTVAVRHGLVLFSIVAIGIVIAMLWRARRTFTLTSIALALILGGAIGNVYDRVRYHYVVDFIEVHIFHYHWPDFNLADSCIVIGACLLMIEIFRPQPVNESTTPTQ
ncbi:MAG TPA: signal peptidase II [Edaphobacter sp.]